MVRKNPRKQPSVIQQPEGQTPELADSVIDTVREPLIALDQDLRVVKVNRSFYETFKLKPEETLGQHIYELGNKQLDIPRLRELLESIIPQTSTHDGYEIEYDFPAIGWRTILINARQIPGLLGKERATLLAIEDITERKLLEKALAEKAGTALSVSEGKYRALVENINDVLFALDTRGNITYVSPVVERLSKYKVSDLIGKPLTQFIYPDDLPALLDRFTDLLTGQLEPWEFHVVDKDGRIIFVRTSSRPVYKDGEVVGITTLMTDITERKKSEDRIKESEEQLRSSLENAPDGVFMFDLEGNFLYGNRRCEEIIGYQREELQGKSFLELNILAKNSIARAAALLQLSREGNSTGSDELVLIRKDGRLVPVEINTSVLRRKGQVVVLAFVRDITERKQAEEALLFTRFSLDNMADTMVCVDRYARFIDVNEAFCHASGYSREELLSLRVSDIDPDYSAEMWPEFWKKLKQSGSLVFETLHHSKEGRIYPVEISATYFEHGGKEYHSAFARDITERKQKDKALKASEAQYHLLSEHITDVVLILDMNLKFIYVSPSVEKMRGFTPLEAMEMSLEKHLTPESLKLAGEVFLEEIPRTQADPGYNPIPIIDLEYYCKDGTTRYGESKFSIIRNSSGMPVSILGEVRDITERKLTEEKLLKSYESVKKTMNDAINTMVKMVEMRDPYTAGHQHRVADLATNIAREMKLDDYQVDQLRTAAVIHDIGKMYIPSDILSKPGRLSDIEFSLIKTHSQSGYDIVKGMDLPIIVAQAILQHHERLDGSGYPGGLKSEDTLLEAKILAVADVVEAMAADRPYRPALGIEKALAEISKNRGRLYDPDVAEACLDLFNSGRFEFKPV